SYGRTSESVQPVLPAGVHRTDTSFSAGFDASWELDVWGRVSRAVESADAAIEASIEDWRDLQVILYAEVALSYLEARALQERIRYAEANVEIQKGSLKLTNDRFEAEISPELDVRQAELNLASTEASIPALRGYLSATINRISVLLGENPGPLREEFEDAAGIPAPPEQVFVGIPANLLRQRPDVRSAERKLAAQTARIGVATADLYPTFRIDGFLTQQTVGTTAGFFSTDNTAWSIIPGIRWNLFDGGRVRAVIDVEDERTKQALLFYEQTVLVALEEVENALTAYLREKERLAALTRAVRAAERSVELSRTLYTTGISDFQNVLDMERELARQQDSLAASEGIVAQSLVQLYKALGGGWDPRASVPEEEEKSEEASS
ncbi:MAG: efflux transporter outer membrane subunit, partial [Planctomycetota bacterium]